MNIPSWISTLGVVRNSRRRLSFFARGGRQKQRANYLHGNAPKAHHKSASAPPVNAANGDEKSSACCFSNVRNVIKYRLMIVFVEPAKRQVIN